ncbi:MAG: hypothetical protein KDA77_16515, partial [Planctomycetaceae bacterium]|nr:hypothetical protein [Planctomycetaceae bacterium]
ERFPHRLAFQVAFTQQLFEAGHYAELIEYVEQLQQQQIEDVRLTNLLAWSYMKTKRYQKAIREFERAFSMPDQKMLRRDLIQGINLAQETLDASYQPASENQESEDTAENQDLKLAKTYLRLSYIQKAEQILSEALKKPLSYQNHQAELQTLLAKVYLAEGRKTEALAQLNQAIQSGNVEARLLSDMLEREERVENFLKIREKNRDEKITQQAAAFLPELLALAQFYAEEGVPGKALSLLERANICLPNEPQLLKLLLKFQLFYALIPEVEETLLQLQTLDPHDPELAESVQKIEWRKQTPRF